MQHSLPATRAKLAKLANGSISYRHVKVIVDNVLSPPDEAWAEALTDVDREPAADAGDHRAGTLPPRHPPRTGFGRKRRRTCRMKRSRPHRGIAQRPLSPVRATDDDARWPCAGHVRPASAAGTCGRHLRQAPAVDAADER